MSSHPETPPETVFLFDRDHTVDVNPPPENECVPLEWVLYIAHGTDDSIQAWASGNQHLRREAALPGFQEAIAQWGVIHDADVWETYDRRAPGSTRPDRRDGLRIITDLYDALHPDADIDFYVVDDADLSDMIEEGITHYFPWDFPSAVSAGELPVSIPDDNPFCGEPTQGSACDCPAADLSSTTPDHVNAMVSNR